MGVGLLSDALVKGLVLIVLIALTGCDGRIEKAELASSPDRLSVTGPNGYVLPLPRELPRQLSVETAYIAADEYVAAWPSQHVVPGEGSALEFAPRWDSAAPDSTDLSFALYSLSAPMPADYCAIRFNWSQRAADDSDLWVGVANFDRNAWDWLRMRNTGLVSFATNNYVNASEQLILAVVCLGQDNWVLDQLVVSGDGSVSEGSLIHDEMQREYVLFIPASYTGLEPVPLVFNFHGYTGTAAGHMERGDFRDLAAAAGFLLVHPQGAKDIEGKTHFNVVGHGPGSEIDDVGFTTALLSALATDYNIDQTRVYATGMSNGGFMSYLLACEMSDRFAAVASVAATMADALIADANPAVPVPVLEIHGTADSVVPYEGTAELSSIDEVLQYWAGHNNCNPTPTTTALPDLNTSDGSTVEHIVYGQGDYGVTVELYRIIGGGHTWPSGGYALGAVNRDIDAAEKIWEFFARYDSNGLIE